MIRLYKIWLRRIKLNKIIRREKSNMKLFSDFGLDYDDVNLRMIVKNDIWKEGN